MRTARMMMITAALLGGASTSLATALDSVSPLQESVSRQDASPAPGTQAGAPSMPETRSLRVLSKILRGDASGAELDQAIAELDSMVASGNAEAAELLGTEYSRNRGALPVDYAKAAQYLEKAAMLGRPENYVALGKLHDRELGGLDKPEALKFYEAAGNAGVADAYFWLGNAYRTGAYGPQDSARSISWYQKAAENGDMKAAAQLVSLYRAGTGGEDDGAMQVKYLQMQADAGDSEALRGLADVYLRGKAVPQDLGKAEQYWREAIAAGNIDSAVDLGNALMRNRLGENRSAEGISLLTEAYEGGKINLASIIADAYRRGRGVEADPVKALAILKSAHAQGDTASRDALLSLYALGAGSAVAPDRAAAVQLLESIPDSQRSSAVQASSAVLAATARPAQLDQMWTAFSATEPQQRRAIGRSIFAANKNAYVYLLQHIAAERGYFSGTPNGLLTSSTISAVNKLCAALDVTNACRFGPLRRTTWDAIAEKAFAGDAAT